YFSHGNTLLEASYIGYPSTFQYRAIASAPNYGRNYQSPLVLSSKSATCATGLPIFQQFPISKDCVDAILTDSSDRSQLEQTIYEANLQGGVFELPAGQLRAAAGASYRTNSYIFRPDPIRATNYFQDVGVGQFGAVTSGGETRVREVYGELLVPVLKDLPGAQKLDLELGFRQSMYDTGAGDVSTYKILGVWSPLQWINIRGGYQKANRAPNIAELFLGETTIVTFNGVDPCRSGVNTTNNWYNNATNPNRAQTQALCSAQIGNPGSDFNADPNSFNSGGGGLGIQLGNPALKSESGETWTLGTVFRSPFESALARGMSLSVDYFKAEISDNIGIPDAQSILDACFNRQGENPTYSLDDAGGNCRRINRDQFTGGLSRVLTPYQNLGGLKTSGIDVGFSWRASLADLGTNLPGNTSFSAQATHVIEYLSQTTATSAPLDNVGYSNLPKWRLNTRVGYSLREFSAGLTWRFQTSVDSAALQTNPAAPNLGGPAYSRFDGNAGYGFGPLDVRLSISNLLNKAPPTYGNNPWSTGAGTFLPGADLVGRRYTVTATMRL
ncbi:TonB-dependent receptor, partial [bacterium]